MSETLSTASESSQSPEKSYHFEATPVDSIEAGILGGLAYAYCSGKCPIRQQIEQAGLACPFVIAERSQRNHDQTWDDTDPSLHMLGQVAENTWLHCVDDIKNGGEPVILLNFKVND